VEETVPTHLELDEPTRVDTRRAPRFAIRTRVDYRVRETEPFTGVTVNISRAGVLVRTSQDPPRPGTALHLRITFGPYGCADAVCTGRVVRTSTTGARGEALMAATIDGFHLQPAASGKHLVTTGIPGNGSQSGEEV
jgi:hypothetical protein